MIGRSAVPQGKIRRGANGERRQNDDNVRHATRVEAEWAKQHQHGHAQDDEVCSEQLQLERDAEIVRSQAGPLALPYP